jgi:hypothetical protein
LNGFSNITVIEKAVSSQTAKGELWVAEYSGGSALTTAETPPDAKQRVPVEVVAIDDLIFQQNLPRPAVVKIDVEGAEIDVLRGMARTLEDVRPVVAYEIDDGNAGAFDRKYQACESFLRDRRYRVDRLEDWYPNQSWLVGHGIATPL